MKKTGFFYQAICLFVLLISSNITNGQRFMHSIGLSGYAGGEASALGVTYSPRFNISEVGNEGTLSIGTHIGLAFGNYNAMDGMQSDFAFDFPLVAEWNFGHASSEDASSSFGGFLGAGLGFSTISSTDGSSNRAIGPIFNGGVRTTIRETSVGLRLSYLKSTKSSVSDVVSIGIFYNLGDL